MDAREPGSSNPGLRGPRPAPIPRPPILCPPPAGALGERLRAERLLEAQWGKRRGQGEVGGVGKGRALEAERTDARGEGAAEGAAGAAGAGRGVAARAADGRGDGMRPPSLPSCRPRLRRRD